MSDKKDFSLQGFEKTLNPKTVAYIDEKSSSMNKVDLRELSDNVVKELKDLENEAAFDYLKIENETLELLDEINKSDNILCEQEDVLVNFRDSLSDVKKEMTFLQERSLTMNISLNNRKNLAKTFSSFIDNVMLEPSMIEDILKKDIDENYVEYIRKLCKKQDYIKKYNLMDNQCIKEIEPEQTKLKLKACDRVRAFVINQINLLKKPQTNIQIIQQNNLIKYKMFLQFLRDHNQAAYFEICHSYSEIMNKIYTDNFKTYINELSKLQIEGIAKNDFLFPEAFQSYKTNPFSCNDRLKVVNTLDEQPIITHAANKGSKKFFPEALYKSLNKLLVESAGQEYTFCLTFFSLASEQASVLFAGIFKQTVLSVIAKIKSWLQNSYDPYSPLQMATINQMSKENFNTRGFDILDYYFDQINFEAWPTFSKLYDVQFENLKNVNSRLLKQIEKVIDSNRIYERALDYIITLSEFSKDNQMLQFRIKKTVEGILNIIENMSKEEAMTDKEMNIYKINKTDLVRGYQENARSVDNQIKYDIEGLLDSCVDKAVEGYQNDNFSSLREYVNNIIKTDNKQKSNTNMIENVSKEFHEFWMTKQNNQYSECESKFGKSVPYKKIIKKVQASILEDYKQFYDSVRVYHPTYVGNMLPKQKQTNDIRNQINALD